MTDLQIADMLADYHKECELAETLREKADVQLKHVRLIREALRQPPVMVRSEQLPILKNIAEQYIYDAGMRNVEMQISYAGIKAIIEEWERMKLARQ